MMPPVLEESTSDSAPRGTAPSGGGGGGVPSGGYIKVSPPLPRHLGGNVFVGVRRTYAFDGPWMGTGREPFISTGDAGAPQQHRGGLARHGAATMLMIWGVVIIGIALAAFVVLMDMRPGGAVAVLSDSVKAALGSGGGGVEAAGVAANSSASSDTSRNSTTRAPREGRETAEGSSPPSGKNSTHAPEGSPDENREGDVSVKGTTSEKTTTSRTTPAPTTTVRPTSTTLTTTTKTTTGVLDRTFSLERKIMCIDPDRCDKPFFGVNLAGWLILKEDLWSPMMRDVGVHDEWTFIDKRGGPLGEQAITAMHDHWGTFVTDKDLDRMMAFGVTHCRIPLGAWLLDGDAAVDAGFVKGGERYLFRLVAWLKQRGMKAVLALTGAPGGQAANAPWTGKRRDAAEFFTSEAHFEEGKVAIGRLVHLVRSFDDNALTRGVIVGMELLDEPDPEFWATSPGVREFYEEMIPVVRSTLAPEKCAVLLSFAGPAAKSDGAEWLRSKRREAPEDFAGVFYDAHISHRPGGGEAKTLLESPATASCKTCCRDPALLKLWAGVPVVVGEFSAVMGLDLPHAAAFWTSYVENQLSLWASTPNILGAFFASHRSVAASENATMAMLRRRRLADDAGSVAQIAPSLLAIIATVPRGWTPEVSSRLCPGEDLDKCPDFESEHTSWRDDCQWEG